MSRISVELIPRDTESLLADAQAVRALLPGAGLLNVPDLTRFALRSWNAAPLLRGASALPVIPHVRAIDLDPSQPLPGFDDPELREVLVVAGDPPADPQAKIWPNTSVDIITRYRRELPHLTIWAAFDPYRRAPRDELEQVARKCEAGAVGVFTQPVFDRTMLEVCARWLEDVPVFWGVSPVVGPKSRQYWEQTNRVVFPRDFSLTLEANIAFACKVLDFAQARGDHAYLMPLRVSLARYLPALQASLSSTA